MRISDWSSDVCSSDLRHRTPARTLRQRPLFGRAPPRDALRVFAMKPITEILATMEYGPSPESATEAQARSEEHTSELQSLMRISYAVFCLKKKNHNK